MDEEIKSKELEFKEVLNKTKKICNKDFCIFVLCAIIFALLAALMVSGINLNSCQANLISLQHNISNLYGVIR